MPLRTPITFDQAKEIFDYDQETGIVRWRKNMPPRGKKGCEAGMIVNGYRTIGVARTMVRTHRLIWLMMTGSWPTCQVDHKNRNPLDNSWSNLREATHGQNQQNTKTHKQSKSGIKGVHKRTDCNRWTAFINADRKVYYLGLFKTKEEAVSAYNEAAKRLHGEFGVVQ